MISSKRWLARHPRSEPHFTPTGYYFRDSAPGRNYPPNSGDYTKRKIA
jgi:hypothetical protein